MDNFNTVNRFFREVVEKQDVDVLDEIIHPNYQAKPVSKNKAASKLNLIDETKLSEGGIEGIKNRQVDLFDQFSEFKVMITDIVEEKEQLVVFYELTFTHTGVWNHFQPTGKKISIAAVNLFKFEAGKIIEIKAILGTIDLLKQLGANVDLEDQEEVNEYLLLLRDFIYSE